MSHISKLILKYSLFWNVCEAFGKPLIEFPLFSYYQVTRQKENIFGKIFVMFLQVIT